MTQPPKRQFILNLGTCLGLQLILAGSASANPSLRGWPRFLAGHPAPLIDECPVAPAVGDLRGDGEREVIVAMNPVEGQVELWALDREGVPLRGWPWRLTLDPSEHDLNVSELTVANIDQAPGEEVLLSITSRSETGQRGRVYIVKGDGTLLAGWPKPIQGQVLQPVVGDLDGDRVPDIVVASEISSARNTTAPDVWAVYAFQRNGAPLANFPVQLPARLTAPFQSAFLDDPTPPTLADVDGDGKPEILLNVGTGVLRLDAGKLTVDDPLLYVLDHAGRIVDGWPKPGHAKPAVGDLDGDGVPEVVSFPYAYHAGGRALDGWPVVVPNLFRAWNILGDLDGDGQLEIVTSESTALTIGSNQGWIAVRDRAGRLKPGWPQPSGKNLGRTYWMAIGNLDDDAAAELMVIAPVITRNPTGGVESDDQILAWNGDGTPVPSWTAPTNEEYAGIVLADLDGDGRLDGIVDQPLEGGSTAVQAWQTRGAVQPGARVWSQFQHDAQQTGRANRPPAIQWTKIYDLGGSILGFVSGRPITFEASAIDPDGDVLTYAWNLGNHVTALGPAVRYAYSRPGTYTVTLRVSDGQATVSKPFTINVIAPPHRPSLNLSQPRQSTRFSPRSSRLLK